MIQKLEWRSYAFKSYSNQAEILYAFEGQVHLQEWEDESDSEVG